MDPLQDYYEGLRDAPIPARLLSETPPEAFVRRSIVNLAWAAGGLALVLVVSGLPSPHDAAAAASAARGLSMRVAMRSGVAR